MRPCRRSSISLSAKVSSRWPLLASATVARRRAPPAGHLVASPTVARRRTPIRVRGASTRAWEPREADIKTGTVLVLKLQHDRHSSTLTQSLVDLGAELQVGRFGRKVVRVSATCVSVCLSVCLSVCPPACQPASLPACLSGCLSVCPSVSACLSPCLSGSALCVASPVCHCKSPSAASVCPSVCGSLGLCLDACLCLSVSVGVPVTICLSV